MVLEKDTISWNNHVKNEEVLLRVKVGRNMLLFKSSP